jgi:hypothetical protein
MNIIKKYIKPIGYLISIFFLYLMFKDTNFSLVIENLQFINPYYIVLALILNIGFFSIRGLYQINNIYYIKRDIKFITSIGSMGILYFYNSIFPARLGEVLRAMFLSKREGINKASIFSYIFIEKILDLLVILVLLSLIVIYRFEDAKLTHVLEISLTIVVFLIAGLFIYIQFNEKILSLLKKYVSNKIYEQIFNLNLSVIEGFRCFRTSKQIIIGMFLLMVGWTIVMGIYWLISYPYVLLLGLPNYSCLFFMVFSALSLTIPSAPAGIGVVHYGLFWAVKLLSNNIESQINLVVAFVVMLHFSMMVVDLLTCGSVLLYYKIYNK